MVWHLLIVLVESVPAIPGTRTLKEVGIDDDPGISFSCRSPLELEVPTTVFSGQTGVVLRSTGIRELTLRKAAQAPWIDFSQGGPSVDVAAACGRHGLESLPQTACTDHLQPRWPNFGKTRRKSG